MSNFYEGLSNYYSTQKTLRFELKPIGATRNTIKKNKILEQDVQLAEDYKKVKLFIDHFHKKVIEESLATTSLSEKLLEEMFCLTCESDYSYEDMTNILEKLRKEVVAALTSHKDFKKLFGKEMILEILPKFVEKEEELRVIEKFNKSTTLFQNYYDIRRNLYSPEEKYSTVAYRLIHENLPRFIENIKVFEVLCNSSIDFSDDICELETELGKLDMDKLFSMKGFNDVLTQKGIDLYNQLIGGISTENTKKRGLNECINLWNQQNPNSKKLPMFVPLYKQLLSERSTCSFVFSSFESDEDVLKALKESFLELKEKIFESANGLSLTELFQNFSEYDMSGVYVKSGVLTELSLQTCGQWKEINTCFSKQYDDYYNGKKKFNTVKYDVEKQKHLKSITSRSVKEIQDVLNTYHEDRNINLSKWFRNQAAELEGKVRYHEIALSSAIKEHAPEKSLRQHVSLISKIKDYLDAIKELQAFMKLLEGSKLETKRDEVFYSKYNIICDNLIPFNGLYNKVRNYVTQKPFSEVKTKLNFEVSSLLSGWAVSKESTNLGMILRKENKYYLGIAEKDNRQLFRELTETDESDIYEKMEYKLLPGPNKMLPKVFFSEKGMEKFTPSEEILKIYKEGTFKKGNSFSLADCHKLIDFFKESIDKHEEWSLFGFKFTKTEEYHDISEFYREVANQGYKMNFKKVPAAIIDQMVKEGRLYLFQIYNKDFSEYSKGNLDLQTIYFKMLFDERNLENVVYKLNGEAEIFYRNSSIELNNTPIHKANKPVGNKNPLNEKRNSLFEYDIVKNKRYTKEKFLLHLPITLNFKAREQVNLNVYVQEKIRKEDDMHIIGINRGERNLLYAVVINSRGDIVDSQQFSLNVIENRYKADNGKTMVARTDYHELLDRREKERDAAQQNWRNIEQIKDIKQGYLSQAIHSIVKLAIKYNAIIVMEDLDADFVRGRQKIDKQIYQNFEKMLLQKLNFLVTDKDRNLVDVHKQGAALNAYQLANKFESFNKVGKQSGIIFYVTPWNISKMDPTTGFIDFLYARYENMSKAKDFISKFESIRYNPENQYFEFSFDYNNFTLKADGTKTDWTVCTYGRRLEISKNTDNNMLETREYYPTDELKKLLEENGIDYREGQSFLKELLDVNDAAFFKELIHILRMTLQMMNYSAGKGTDGEEFFQSCVLNNTGCFYNSMTADDTLPKNIDANGAYNIAKKGLYLVERIKHAEDAEKLSLSITSKDWLNFVQEKM